MAMKMEKVASENTVPIMEKAVSIYQGVFLPDDDEPWVVPMRQRLSREFVRCVRWIGRHYEETGQWEEAISCYNRGLKIDPLIEGFYRCLIRCYLKEGKPSAAKRTFLQCRETLSKVLGVEPSEETKNLLAGM